MNDQKPPQVDVARHENSSGINPDDIDLLAAFTQRVSSELYTVDNRNVGSNSNIKALQLDQKKILQGVDPARAADEPTNRSASKTVPVEQSNPVSQPVTKSAPIMKPPRSTTSDVDLETRLMKLENSFKLYRKAKRIKKGVSYSVSSNSFKGVIKDGEMLADYVLSEVAKGVKTITIKINDSKNKEPK